MVAIGVFVNVTSIKLTPKQFWLLLTRKWYNKDFLQEAVLLVNNREKKSCSRIKVLIVNLTAVYQKFGRLRVRKIWSVNTPPRLCGQLVNTA